MTYLDAYGLVALAADEAAAAEVEELLRTESCRVVAINLAEAVDVCIRRHGLAVDEVRDVVRPLFLAGNVELAVSGEAEAWRAADLRARHYDRRACAVSIADCLVLAHAVSTSAAVATSDPAIAAVARAEAVPVVALPDSSGVRP